MSVSFILSRPPAWGLCITSMGAVTVALIIFLVWILATDPTMAELSSMDTTNQWRQMVDGCRSLADAKQPECLALADSSFR